MSTTPSDAIEAFRAAMSAAGIEYTGQICADGKLHRFKAEGDHERNSWYVLHAGPPAAGAFGCWKRDLKESWSDRSRNLSQADLQRVRQRSQETEATVKAAMVVRQKKARQIADWIIARAKAVATHAYLDARQVQSHGDLREYRGALVMPLRDLNGDLQSLQFVGADGSKNFLTGGRVAGCFFTLADKADGPLVICEGYATGASIHEATGHSVICCMNCGNLLEVAKAVRELWPQREIIVAADNDQWTTKPPNPGLTKATAAAKAIHAKLALPQFKDTANRPTDFNDLATGEGLDAVKEQIGAAQIPAETDADTYARLAALSPAEYDRCRDSEAAALGIRVKTLDGEVERLRPWTGGNDSTLQGCAIDLPDVEPWPQPVNGAEILEAVSDAFSRYLALPPGAADEMALWVTHTHCFEVFDITPRQNITSPEKGCGKTTAGDVLGLFVPRPLRSENLTPAVLFRLIEKQRPTVIADEYDNWLRDNDELRSMFNAGHRRGGKALRCEGDNHEVRGFRVYGPAVLCGIGPLPGPLHDRSIVIRLERAKPGEIPKRFDSRRTDREQELCRKLARWCADNRVGLETCDPTLPESASNRLADNWRPLFVIAEVAGGDWPKRVAAAFDKLTRREDPDAQGMGTMLLADIQRIFAGTSPPPPEGKSPSPVERMFSRNLVQCLCTMEERPWGEANRGKPITEGWLARHLRRFNVHSTTLRIGDDRAKGYEQTDFTNAFERYLSSPGEFNRDSVTCQEKDGFVAVTNGPVVTDQKTPSTEGMSRCHAQDTPANDVQLSPDPNLQVIDQEALVL